MWFRCSQRPRPAHLAVLQVQRGADGDVVVSFPSLILRVAWCNILMHFMAPNVKVPSLGVLETWQTWGWLKRHHGSLFFFFWRWGQAGGRDTVKKQILEQLVSASACLQAACEDRSVYEIQRLDLWAYLLVTLYIETSRHHPPQHVVLVVESSKNNLM